MDQLSDDVFHHIVSFLPSCSDLANVAMTSSRAFSVIHHSSMPIFRVHWKRQFGSKGDRRSYQSRYNLHQLLKHPKNNNQMSQIRKAGLLTPAQEHAALLYDHGAPNATCMGYFGMQLLWDYGPVAIWGDFRGIRIFYGVGGLLDDRERSVVSIGEDESHVLCVLSLPAKKRFFIGFSSGKVVCIQATWMAKHEYAYTMISSATPHSNEVTSLCALPEDQGLLSASVDGSVYKYPHAMTKGDLQEGASEIVQVGAAVLTMSTLEHRGRTFLLTGDQAGHVTLWWEIDDTEWRHSYIHLQNVPTQSLLWLDGNDLYIIIGDNEGLIVSLRLDYHSELEYMGKTSESVLQGWPVECFTVLGDILLVGAGRKTVAFSLPDVRQSVPATLGFPLPCHPNGQRPASVVSIIISLVRQSCVTLCRDGTLHEWSLKNQDQALVRKRSTKRKQVSESGNEVEAEHPSIENAKKNRIRRLPMAGSDGYTIVETNPAHLKQTRQKRERTRGQPPKIHTVPVPARRNGSGSAARGESTLSSSAPAAQVRDNCDPNLPSTETSCLPASSMDNPKPPKKKRKPRSKRVVKPPPERIKRFEDLDEYLKQAPERDAQAMSMRIIQAGFQHFSKNTQYFMGLNNEFYMDIIQAFDAYSGLTSCSACSGVYQCRITNGHTENLQHDCYKEKLLRKLSESNPSINAIPDLDGWTCDQCFLTCKNDRRRCFLCLRWKDGKRIPEGSFQVKASLAKTQAQPVELMLPEGALATASEVPKSVQFVPNADDSTVTDTTEASTSSSTSSFAPRPPSEDTDANMLILDWDVDESLVDGKVEKMWTCKCCFALNSMRRHRCKKCHQKSGGAIIKVVMAPPRQHTEDGVQTESPFRDCACQSCGTINDPAEFACCHCGDDLHRDDHETAGKQLMPQKVSNDDNDEPKVSIENTEGTESIAKWSCRKCTYMNDFDAVACEVCSSIRSRATAC